MNVDPEGREYHHQGILPHWLDFFPRVRAILCLQECKAAWQHVTLGDQRDSSTFIPDRVCLRWGPMCVRELDGFVLVCASSSTWPWVCSGVQNSFPLIPRLAGTSASHASRRAARRSGRCWPRRCRRRSTRNQGSDPGRSTGVPPIFLEHRLAQTFCEVFKNKYAQPFCIALSRMGCFLQYPPNR